MSVSLLVDATILNPADAVLQANRTTVNLRPGTGIAMTKQTGDDIVLSNTSTPSAPGVIGGHTIYTTQFAFNVAQSQRVNYPFDLIESSFGTPVATLGPALGEVTILCSVTYGLAVLMSYIWPATRFAYLILDRAGFGGLLNTVMYTPSISGLLATSNMTGVFNLVAGDILKVTVDGFDDPGVANYVTFASSDTRWDITRIY